MSDRPIAGVLAAVAAALFVAGFAGAAVTRPETAVVAEESAPSASAATTETKLAAALTAPSLSRVAALPALHLPVHRKHVKKAKAKAKTQVQVSTSTPAPIATPRAPVATAVPQRQAPVAPRRSPSKTFDTSG